MIFNRRKILGLGAIRIDDVVEISHEIHGDAQSRLLGLDSLVQFGKGVAVRIILGNRHLFQRADLKHQRL